MVRASQLPLALTRHVLAFIVCGHAVIYYTVGWDLPGPITAWQGTSRLLDGLVSVSALRSLSIALHVAAGLITFACAAAIAWAPAVPGLWRPLAMAAGVMGLLAFAVFWDGQTQLLFEEGAIGAIVSLVLLLGALAVPRSV